MVVHETEATGMAAYRALFEHSADGVLVCSLDGRVSAANPTACALLALSAEEICQLGYDDLVDQEDPRWRLTLAERDRTGVATGVARLRRGDGRYVELETTSRVFDDESGSLGVLVVLRDVTSRMEVEREIEELSARLLALARADELTGLANRRGLLAMGTRLLQVADRHGADVAALFVDVGNVKELNVRFGHQAGDAALQAVARALSVTFRQHDVLARVGGTAFLVLALRLPEHDCVTIASRVRDHLAGPETTTFVGEAVEVSLGWTTRHAGESSSLEDLMARSDWAMLEARQARCDSRGGTGPIPPR